jgi:hypothetical protein
MESFRQKQMKFDELIQLEWENAAEYFRERDKKYGTAEWRVLVVVQPRQGDDASAPPQTAFAEHMESLDVILGILQLPQGTSRPGSCHIWLGLVKPLPNSSISGPEPAPAPDRSPLLKAKPVEPVSF